MVSFSVSRLFGAPPGYVGYDEGGQLTEAVRRNPYSIILFDDVEKAHPDVFNLLLQVLDDGRITDSMGRTVDFKNTVIIMTSNLGSQYLLNKDENTNDKINDCLNKAFKPEFLNRIDEIIIFNPLDRNVQIKIVSKMLYDLTKRLKEQDVDITFDESVKEYIINESFNYEFGARPIKRFIQKNIETLIAREIISSNIKPHDKLVISYDEKFIIKKV